MSAYGQEAETFAASLLRQAVAVSALSCAVLVLAPVAASGRGWAAAVLLTGAALFALAALALSALLAFDAFLFRAMAGEPDEMSGGALVDRLLAAARLKLMPEETRGLRARIAGTRRLLAGQRAATLLSLLASASALLATRGAA